MIEKKELFYALALQSVEGLGPVGAKKLLDHYGGFASIFENIGKERLRVRKWGSELINKLKSQEIRLRAEKELKFLEDNNIRGVLFDHPSYPEKLKHCADAPVLIFQKGNFDINGKRVISIVGTRAMTNYGSGFLSEFIREMKVYDPVIVSGLAFGIDIRAHREALLNDIPTIGILGHGLDRMYPKAHEGTALKMLQKGGLYTEFWSGSRAEKVNFIKRNRIIAGISEATVVVESAGKGGSLVTARLASSYDREVLAVPGRFTDKFSEGCNTLIKDNRAAMITSANDLEEILGWSGEGSGPVRVMKTPVFELGEEERKVYGQLEASEKKLLDEISMGSGLSVQKTISILLQLELKGLVSSHAGKRFRATNALPGKGSVP